MSERARSEKCFHWRTKSMYIAAWSDQTPGEEAPETGCWCNRTLRELGPDGEPADRVACSEPGRSCYRSPSSQ